MSLRCAIATPHPLATEAGEEAIRGGGNAIDAALAAAAVLTVVYPHMCSIGGDLFALVARSGEVVAIDGSGAAAEATDVDGMVSRYVSMPTSGVDTVTVPGVLSGWEEIAALGAIDGISTPLEAAASHARDGVAVSASLAESILEDQVMIAADPGLSDLLVRDGELLGVGDPLVQPELGRTLEAIASEGVAAFYRGEIGRRFAAGLSRMGSPLTSGDLEAHRARRAEPLRAGFRGHEILTSPPGSQGFVLLEVLAAVERSGRDDLLDRGAGVLARLFRLASADRDRYLADPAEVEVPVEELLSAGHVEGLAQAAAAPGPIDDLLALGRPRPGGDTVAVVAADSEGRAVSLIQSVFHSFGAGILEPATGVICHNRGACFSLDPGSPNLIGPGKRPAHTLMPVLVKDGAGRISAHGTMGGRAQPQIHTEILLRRLGGSSPRDAVADPRFVVGGLDAGTETDVVFAEAGLAPATVDALSESGMEVREAGALDETFGHAQLAVLSGSGLAAASDPRSDGTARVAEGARR